MGKYTVCNIELYKQMAVCFELLASWGRKCKLQAQTLEGSVWILYIIYPNVYSKSSMYSSCLPQSKDTRAQVEWRLKSACRCESVYLLVCGSHPVHDGIVIQKMDEGIS